MKCFLDGAGAPFTDPPAAWLDELVEFLRIESISGDHEHARERRAAVDWLCSLGSAVAGRWEVREVPGLSPYLIGRVAASPSFSAWARPHVLLYGHADVQPPGPLEAWKSPPFEPEVRAGWLHARGVADDKGNVYALIKGMLGLAATGRLPVDVTVLVDTDEETSGEAAIRHLADDQTTYDACLIYDAPTTGDGQAVFVVGARGLLVAEVLVRTGEAEVHSGLYGGAALNAAHVLTQMLARVVPLPDALRVGARPQDPSRLAEWNAATAAGEELAQAGARAAPDLLANGFYETTFASPSLDINGVACGDAVNEAMIVPCEARARLSMRLAPGQDPELVAGVLRDILCEPPSGHAMLDVTVRPTSAGVQFESGVPAVETIKAAFTGVMGRAPRELPNGATVPILAALDARGVPTVLTGFATPASNFHGPDEGLPLNAVTVAAQACARSLQMLGGVGPGDGSA
jgi:acetylornithine deacetylase/succinyl-diaminopimelate desuccinylase-like protein